MLCPVCDQTVEQDQAWKVGANGFYCSEFCADSEADAAPVVALRPSLKERFDSLYMQRLERLAALRRQAA
jgi:hypothetical protein